MNLVPTSCADSVRCFFSNRTIQVENAFHVEVVVLTSTHYEYLAFLLQLLAELILDFLRLELLRQLQKWIEGVRMLAHLTFPHLDCIAECPILLRHIYNISISL